MLQVECERSASSRELIDHSPNSVHCIQAWHLRTRHPSAIAVTLARGVLIGCSLWSWVRNPKTLFIIFLKNSVSGGEGNKAPQKKRRGSRRRGKWWWWEMMMVKMMMTEMGESESFFFLFLFGFLFRFGGPFFEEGKTGKTVPGGNGWKKKKVNDFMTGG